VPAADSFLPPARGDIYGDGVNVAARLEAPAEPGGICISGTVWDHIREKLPYAFEDLGEQAVKNIARPVRVLAMRPAAVASVPGVSVPAQTTSRRSIGRMPARLSPGGRLSPPRAAKREPSQDMQLA